MELKSVPLIPNLYAAARSGDELTILLAARDNLIKIMATCKDGRSYGSLNKQLLDTLRRISELEAARREAEKPKETRLNVIQSIHSARMPGAKDQVRAKVS